MGGSPKPPTFQTLKSLEDPERRRCVELPVDGTQDILVWWDIETCPLLPSLSTCAPSLLQELQYYSHMTYDQLRVTINVYGNGGPGSKAALDSLIASGVILQHRILPCKLPGSETAALKTMMVDIALWALSNSAPRNVFLISAARDTSFRDLISGLHMRDYDIHLATKFNFGYGSTEQGSSCDDHVQAHLFNPMPRHWSVSKQLFVVRTAPPSRLQSGDVQLSEELKQVHLNS